MADFIKEVESDRMFERVSRWNILDDTIISDRNRFAQYADNAGSTEEKLILTYFKLRNHVYPLNMFAKLVNPIKLTDHTTLTRQDTENTVFYLEVNATKDKVRLYKEVT